MIGVSGHLATLVPGQGPAQLLGQPADRGTHRVGDGGGGVVVGQMEQQHEPGDAFDQGPDRGPAAGAEDEVAFPMAGHDPVGGLGGTFGDVDHALQLRLGLPPLGFAADPAGAQRLFDLLGQLALVGLEGLVDRLCDNTAPDRLGSPVRVKRSAQDCAAGYAFNDLGEQSTGRHELGGRAGPEPVLIARFGRSRPETVGPWGRPGPAAGIGTGDGPQVRDSRGL